MNWKKLLPVAAVVMLTACNKNDYPYPKEDAASFAEISAIDVGEAGAAEISAFDPLTKKLFVITNSGAVTAIQVYDLSNPTLPTDAGFIDIAPFGGNVNSVAVRDGKLAAAIEGFVKTDPGKVVVFKTRDHSVVKEIPVGALPDMITFTHDGDFILTANEGEPNSTYTIDPKGTVSIIAVKQNYAVTNVDFRAFAGQAAALKAKGLRVFGPGASFEQDMEPEYVTISHNGRTAWVTLQENNAIAKIDIHSRSVTAIFPLGFKNYKLEKNKIDPSDRDGGYTAALWPVYGTYMPDAIAVLEDRGIPFLFTANEGDAREYETFVEQARLKDLDLDPGAFPDAATLLTDSQLGRLNVTTTLGDTDSDGDLDAIYSFGARSFSIWNGYTGKQVYDSGNELDRECSTASFYDDGRSDDKSVEPEGLTLGLVGKRAVAFIAMERADALAIYDVSNPTSPVIIKLLKTGDAPEGVLFVPAWESPTKKSLVIVSSEGDGTVKVYQTN